MKFFKETEKAVQVRMAIEYVHSERTAERMVWIPKSQIRNGRLTAWIASAKLADYAHGEAIADFFDAEGNAIDIELSARSEKRVADFHREVFDRFSRLSFK